MQNWHVITGGPSSGISITTEYLAILGYHTVPEAARILIDTEIAKGRSIEEIRKDELAFQKAVLKMKQDIEKRITKGETVFFQRGIPDTLAYCRFLGIEDRGIYEACRASRYSRIFILESIPYKKDYARTESAEDAMKIYKILKEVYEELGFRVSVIPKASIEERAQMILSGLENPKHDSIQGTNLFSIP